jgi:hypothetical protein
VTINSTPAGYIIQNAGISTNYRKLITCRQEFHPILGLDDRHRAQESRNIQSIQVCLRHASHRLLQLA